MIYLTPTLCSRMNALVGVMNGNVKRYIVRYERMSLSDAEESDPYLLSLSLQRYANSQVGDIVIWGDSLTYGTGSKLGMTFGEYIQERTSGWVAVNGYPGKPSTQIKNSCVGTTRYANAKPIVWIGRNGAGVTGTPIGTDWNLTARTQIKQDIADCLSQYQSDGIVVGIPNGDYASEYFGTTRCTNLNILNGELAALYGPNFVDAKAILLASGDGSTGDNTDLANGVPPRSKRSDSVHLNNAGYALIADAVVAILNA